METGPGVLDGILGKVGLPAGSATPALQQASSQLGGSGVGSGRFTAPLRSGAFGGGLGAAETAAGSAVPWRRSGVRHTSNELYVDLIEEVTVTLAPSGRPLSAFAYGSVAFTSKVSGVPDLALSLTTGGGKGAMGGSGGRRAELLQGVMERVVFHPCVRLNRWKTEGVLSFVPPDGRFALAGYEVDLLGPGTETPVGDAKTGLSFLPASLEVNTELGKAGAEFEVRCSTPALSGTGSSSATASLQSNLGPSRASKPDPKAPMLEDLTIHVPLPAAVRNVSDLRPSRGEAHWNPTSGGVEWKIMGVIYGKVEAVLRCTVQGPLADDEEESSGAGVLNGVTATTYDYDDDQPAAPKVPRSKKTGGSGNGAVDGVQARRERNRRLMPSSATLSFTQKGQLASGLKVESLLVDSKKSRGLGPEVKPYKGVKYLTVSRGGVEVRC